MPIIEDESDFPNDEEAGQLYAYRNSRNEVILRTRESVAMNGELVTVGIQSVANGRYTCVARNSDATMNVTITVEPVGECMILCIVTKMPTFVLWTH